MFVVTPLIILFIFILYIDSQRKGLEKRFQMQKYISKPDRKKLAERLGLKDSQVTFFLDILFFLVSNYAF